MFDSGKIIAGLLIFLALVTFPFWYERGRTATPPALSLDTPEIRKLAVKECVAPAPYMRASHMDLLHSWRDAVVRNEDRVYVSSEGKKYNMSLSQTCLGCHSNKEKFCDTCHNYQGVKPNCWDCHVVPMEGKS